MLHPTPTRPLTAAERSRVGLQSWASYQLRKTDEWTCPVSGKCFHVVRIYSEGYYLSEILMEVE